MESWVTTGLAQTSDVLLGDMRLRLRDEVARGWSLYVADEQRTLAGMLALHLSDSYLDRLFVAPAYHGRSVGRQLLAFTRRQMADEIWLRCARENEKAWRWYEREGFVFENEKINPLNGLMMKYYRWKRVRG
jgi:ribosomal protein S18 acetylase RimI-like enzyme